MAEENVEQLRQAYEAWNRGDRESWVGLAHPEAELILPAVQMMEGSDALRGREGAERVWNVLHDTFSEPRFDVVEIRDLGERTLGRARLRGRGAGSGAPLDQRVWHLIQWRDAQIVRFEAFFDEAEALRAAGLSE
jgi:ketosteroid isomerase-like protein